MRKLLFIFLIGCAVVGWANKYHPAKTAAVTPANAATPKAQTAALNAVAPLGARKVSLYKAYNGHYQAQVDVNGISIGFLIDTGASSIALRQSDAAKIGIKPGPKDYTASISTANGVTRAARVMLKSVNLSGIVVEDVQALILPDSSLGTNLLGMSFLSQVNWSQRGGNLVIEQ